MKQASAAMVHAAWTGPTCFGISTIKKKKTLRKVAISQAQALTHIHSPFDNSNL